MLTLTTVIQESLFTGRSLGLDQLHSLFDLSPLSVLVADRDGIICYVNVACCEGFGYSASELLGNHSELLRSELTPDPVYQSLNKALCLDGYWSGELCSRSLEGHPCWQQVHVSLFNGPHKTPHTLMLMEDLVERLEYEQWLFKRTGVDALTGLPTRVQVYELLYQQIALTTVAAPCIGLLSIDIYRFKQFNESLGHSTADQLLIAISERLKCCLKAKDKLCRLGGDQFVLLAAGQADKRAIGLLASDLRDEFSAPFSIQGHTIFVGLSIGVAVFPDDGRDPVQLFRHADTALYLAKKQGRNRISVFFPELEQQALQRQHLETEFRFALERGELSVHYQPLIGLDAEVQGAEAVMRWNSLSMGLVAPEQFVPLAEAIGMIHLIGNWCLDQACQQAKLWMDEADAPWFVAVNVSPLQLCHSGFVEAVEAVLAKYQLPASRLELEVTEGVLVANREQAASRLDQLSRLGVKLSIDDFGTGYSSLSYLQYFPFNTLKIDRSFIVDMPANRGSAKLVKAIVAMAKSLDLKLVAEGVETSEQVTFLQALNCDLLQGYYFSAPLPATEFLDWVRLRD
ncbi:MAG: diguanylate cyclase (GGDEF)-like protein/PAS domain S-box-containing protein [Motiliproteus sp.]|jgi:diguanylate cyclase (GGDEF)-like protein/PAS domain S-box-containing protein